MKKRWISPIFYDLQELSCHDYGSINDPFGWSLNRRYGNCIFFANLNNFDIFCFLNETISFWTSVPGREHSKIAFLYMFYWKTLLPLYHGSTCKICLVHILFANSCSSERWSRGVIIQENHVRVRLGHKITNSDKNSKLSP